MKGLPSKFYLTKGRFTLIGGAEKASDNIWFYCIFDKIRVYCRDFGGNFISLVQKPISYLVTNKTIYLGTLQRGIRKYVPNVAVNSIDIGYIGNERTNYNIKIDYSAKREDGTEVQGVTFR